MRSYLRQLPTALRMLVVLSVVLGVLYPLVILAVAQLPGLKDRANGSLVRENGRVVGSSLIGQGFTTRTGRPLLRYFQSRPSAGSYDPTASGASNLGPEDVVDAPGDPSLLTQVCARSAAIGRTYGVDGSRPFCTSSGVGAVLAVFRATSGAITRVVSVNQLCPDVPFLRTYAGTTVRCASRSAGYTAGTIVPIRGDAPSEPAVPADAVTSSGSGLDPDISVAYARLQERVVARVRGVSLDGIAALVSRYTTGRALGFMGEPVVNVVRLNLALDEQYPIPR